MFVVILVLDGAGCESKHNLPLHALALLLLEGLKKARRGKPLDYFEKRQENMHFASCFGQKIIWGAKGMAV